MNVEIEVTLRCNRHCYPCNRHCNLFKFIDLSDTDMTLEQIDRFCCQVEERGERLGRISIVGGEPLLHPKLGDIVNLLYTRLKKHRLVKQLIMSTNGDDLDRVHPKVLEHLSVTVSWTKPPMIYTLVAPRDTRQLRKKCTVPGHCGVGLNVWGYWPCGPGAAIARLFGLSQYQRMVFPKHSHDFGDLDQQGNVAGLCDLCQWSTKHPIITDRMDDPSSSYANAIKECEINPVYSSWERF